MSVNVSLQIVVKDPDNSSWTVTFAAISEAKSDFAETLRTDALRIGRKWYGVVASMAESVRSTPTHPRGAQSHANTDSVVEQLQQLVKLHESGSLSSDEFQSAKARILREAPDS